MLSSPALRSILVEIHFGKLEVRGQPQAPIRIEKLLRNMDSRLVGWMRSTCSPPDRYCCYPKGY
jgi:hypothetical protein